MNDEVWQSIEAKIRGHHLAANSLPTSCPKCHNILTPVDFGVDPWNDERLWVTNCCGSLEKYYEKIIPKLPA